VSASGTDMGIAVLPTDYISDVIFEANIKAASLTDKSGLLFRARDLENYYFFYIASDRIALKKNLNNTASTLFESFQAFSPDTYYKLKVEAAGTNISLYLNDNLIQTVSDSGLALGYIALASANNSTYFDDVSKNGTIWDFNSLTAGEVPAGWNRFGINDLPQGSGTLTISEPYNNSTLKQIDATVSWTERGELKTITVSSLRAE
ncbi:hypothetical protein ACFL29_01840, partial [Patescibacteria group bacterium]